MYNKIIFEKEYSFNQSIFAINTDCKRSFSSADINEIAICFLKAQIKPIRVFYKQFLENLMINSNNNIDYQYILSNKMKINYLNHVKQNLKIIKPFLLPYFKDTYPARKSLLSKLKPLLLEGKIAGIPVYSHDTKTGRSRVIAGTNYMTMKKEKRSKLSHPDNNRILLEIDFNSCEPVFYFNFIKNSILIDDLYETIKSDLQIKENRKSLKTAIISILYGAGYDTVKRISKVNKQSYDNIKNYMMINEFHEKIKTDDDNIIQNYYGRPIILLNEKNKVNYWVQSSVADFVYLSFNKFAENYSSFELHAVIHDAMIFSIDKTDWQAVRNIKSLDEDKSNYKIAVKIEQLTDN